MVVAHWKSRLGKNVELDEKVCGRIVVSGSSHRIHSDVTFHENLSRF